MSEEIRRLNQQIKGFEEQIATEAQKLQEDKQAEREERERRLEAFKTDIAETDAQQATVNDAIRTQETLHDELKNGVRSAQQDMDNAKAEGQRCMANIDRITAMAGNRLLPFGNDIRRVLQLIEQQQWKGEKPKGPLGIYVSVHDARTWAPLLRAQLGSILSSFAITDPRDRPALTKILQDTRK